MRIDETTLETKYFLVQLSEHSIFEILQNFIQAPNLYNTCMVQAEPH